MMIHSFGAYRPVPPPHWPASTIGPGCISLSCCMGAAVHESSRACQYQPHWVFPSSAAGSTSIPVCLERIRSWLATRQAARQGERSEHPKVVSSHLWESCVASPREAMVWLSGTHAVWPWHYEVVEDRRVLWTWMSHNASRDQRPAWLFSRMTAWIGQRCALNRAL